MHARIVTTKERKYGDLVRREGSPVPGIELFEPVDGNLFVHLSFSTKFTQNIIRCLGQEVNIASLLLREGHALEDTKVTVPKSASPSPPPVGPPPSAVAIGNHSSSDSKFSAICENTANENFENIKIDNTQLRLQEQRQRGIDSFIEIEKRQLQQRQMQNGHSPERNTNNLTAQTNALLMQQKATSTR